MKIGDRIAEPISRHGPTHPTRRPESTANPTCSGAKSSILTSRAGIRVRIITGSHTVTVTAIGNWASTAPCSTAPCSPAPTSRR
jgi:hypothetical protein